MIAVLTVICRTEKEQNNSTARVVRVETNLPGLLQPVQFCVTGKCLTLKMKVKITKYTSHNGTIQWHISTSIQGHTEHFSLAVTVFPRYTFQVSDLKNVGQSRDVQHSPWHHAKQIPDFLIKIANWKLWPWKCMSKSFSATFAIMPIDGEYHTA